MGMGHFNQDRGNNNLTLTGALQEAASSNINTSKNMGTSGGSMSGKGHGAEDGVTMGHGGQGLGGQILHENDEESATLVVRYSIYHTLSIYHISIHPFSIRRISIYTIFRRFNAPLNPS